MSLATGLAIIAAASAMMLAVRLKIYRSGNSTAINFLKASDTIVMIRFLGGLLFLLVFMGIAISVR
tara:strand:+ start:13841 stop:14038 length:198 start_codon:yes stop_codon:yes gene_type:complete